MRDPVESAGPPSRAMRATLFWIVLAVVFAVYAPSLSNGFALDDPLLARAVLPEGEPNSMVAGLRPLSDYFGASYWEGDRGTRVRLYRPVTILSYAITNELQGGVDADPHWEAFPHHLINVLLHVWSAALAFLLISRLGVGFYPALLGAAVFGLHAIHSEVVAGIVGRAELFGFCFGAQALYLAWPAGHCCRASAACRLGGASVLLFLAFCSKESALAWLPFLFVYAFVAGRSGGPRLDPARALQLAAIGAPPLILFLVLRHGAVGALADTPAPYVANPLWYEPSTTRMLTGITLWGYGLWRCLWPVDLASDYGPVTFDVVRSMFDPRFLSAAAVLLGWLVAGVVLLRRHPLIFLAAACFLGFGFIVSNVPFPIGTIFGERLYFTPSLAVAILVAWAATRTGRRWLLAPLAAWLAFSAIVILANNSAWRDDDHRLLRDVENNRRCVRNLDALARLHRDRGDSERAVAFWKEALELDPDFLHAINEYGNHLLDQGDHSGAERLLLRALQVPERYGRLRHVSFYNLANLYGRTGQDDKVAENVRRAWREDSAFEVPHDPLVDLTARTLPHTETATIAGELERRRPGHPASHLLRGMLAYGKKDYADADRSLRAVLAAQPRHGAARFYLAVTLRLRNREPEARRILEALRVDMTVPEPIRTQAAKLLQ